MKRRDAAGQRSGSSKGHKALLVILRKCFDRFTIDEEVSVRTLVQGKPTVLFLDIFLKELGLGFEVHGRQHSEFVAHFHGDRAGFAKSQARDNAKALALKEQGVTLVEISDQDAINMTEQELMKLCSKAIKQTKS